MAAIHNVDQELFRHEPVDLLPILQAMTVSLTKEVLTHQDRRILCDFGSRLDLLVISDERAAGGEGHLTPLELGLMRGRFEGKIQQGQGSQHFRETVRGLGHVGWKEGLGRIVIGKLVPEGIGRDQRGVLLIQRQLVVVAFDPFHGLVQLAIVLLHELAPRSVGSGKLEFVHCFVGVCVGRHVGVLGVATCGTSAQRLLQPLGRLGRGSKCGLRFSGRLCRSCFCETLPRRGYRGGRRHRARCESQRGAGIYPIHQHFLLSGLVLGVAQAELIFLVESPSLAVPC